MRPLLLALTLAVAGIAAADPAATLVVGAFPQRMSDRYTSSDGLPAEPLTSVTLERGVPRVRTGDASGERSWELRDGRWVSQNQAANAARPPRREGLPREAKLLSYARDDVRGEWWVTDRGVFHAKGGRAAPFPFPKSYLTHQTPVNIDADITCVAVDASHTVWFGSSTGIFSTDGASFWNVHDRTTGLPYEYVTCLALGSDGSIWAGTTEGVCRYTAAGWQYYWGPRWLPHNKVDAIAVAEDGSAWVATDGGVAHLYDRPLTLEQKAAHYEEINAARHNRSGFVTGARLKKPGDPSAGVIHEASDNDGLWTAVYVGAEAFRYAATRDPEARRLAKKSMDAMLDLVKYTGVPGYPARAIFRKGEEVDGYSPDETVRVPGEKEKIWFASPVDPAVLCKGDTSSDELDGHYFAWAVYYDLVADDAEKKAIAAVVRAVTDNLLQHDLKLVGHTGRPTRWGIWDPAHINDDPLWWEERGLNALELLCYLKVADHCCGDARFGAKYREMIEKHHYLLNTVMQKVDFSWHETNHSDDQMAFMMYYALLRLEKDPAIRRVLRQSLERSWKIERPEASPFFNFTYGALTGRPADAEASVATLQAWPWELIEWQVRGTHRHDVTVRRDDSEGRVQVETVQALPISERRLMRWNGNPYEPDGGGPSGTHEDDASAWLLPYWMGRYHGLIAERR
jgi:hypothetical protein